MSLYYDLSEFENMRVSNPIETLIFSIWTMIIGFCFLSTSGIFNKLCYIFGYLFTVCVFMAYQEIKFAQKAQKKMRQQDY